MGSNVTMTDRVVKEIANALIVSCQPVSQGPMDKEEHIVAMVLAAVAGGAGGLRIEGVDNVRAVCALTDVPVIGLVKRDLADSAVRITPLVEDVAKLADAGATIIALHSAELAGDAEVLGAALAIRQHLGDTISNANGL